VTDVGRAVRDTGIDPVVAFRADRNKHAARQNAPSARRAEPMDFAPVPRNAVGTSPYGPEDEIGAST
jgi:hypothetical protein